jgi:hypothetical protein
MIISFVRLDTHFGRAAHNQNCQALDDRFELAGTVTPEPKRL